MKFLIVALIASFCLANAQYQQYQQQLPPQPQVLQAQYAPSPFFMPPQFVMQPHFGIPMQSVLPFQAPTPIAVPPICLVRPLLPICRLSLLASTLVGKRSVENVAVPNETICKFSLHESKLTCSGEQTFECEVESRFENLGKFNYTIEDVKMIPEGYTWTQWSKVSQLEGELENKTIDRIYLYKRVGELVNDFTFEHGERKVQLCIHNAEVKAETGVKTVCDRSAGLKDVCWTRMFNLVKQTRPELLKLSLELLN